MGEVERCSESLQGKEQVKQELCRRYPHFFQTCIFLRLGFFLIQCSQKEELLLVAILTKNTTVNGFSDYFTITPIALKLNLKGLHQQAGAYWKRSSTRLPFKCFRVKIHSLASSMVQGQIQKKGRKTAQKKCLNDVAKAM